MILLVSVLPAAAQTVERTLSGAVVRSDTHRPIAGASVVGGGKATVTGSDGTFALVVPAAKVAVDVAAPGFLALATSVDLTDHDVSGAEFALAPNTQFTSAVDVVGTAPSVSPAATPVAPRDVLKTAGALDNVFRTLQTLPGVSAAEEFGSRITVRGGAPDQNLTVMDGVEIHDPYRLFGLASAFNPEIIRRFELATSGFTAKYGDRLSSVLLIENRDGDASRRLGGSAAMSITDANAVLEGRLPGVAHGSWLVTGRRTYYDLIAARITDQDFPQFADLQAKAVWEPKPNRKLTLFSLRSRQSAAIDVDRQASGDRGKFDDDTRNDLSWIRFDTPLGAAGHAMTVAGYSRTRSSFGVSARFSNRTQRSNSPSEFGAFGTANVVFSQQLEIGDLSLRQELAWTIGTHTIETGGELHRLDTRLKFVIDGDRNNAAANGSSVQGGAGLPDLLDSAVNSTRGGAWLIDTWRPSARASIESGLRLDRTGINAKTSLSPRIAASLVITPALSIRAGLGLYTQSPGYEKTAQSDYVLDYTSVDTRSLANERAVLASLSVERSLGRGFTARVETYYKRISDVLTGRLETEPERQARLSRYEFPADLAWSIPTDAIITTTPTNDGRGRAFGYDVLFSRMTAPVNARLRGWASYTWGKAEREAYGRTFAFEYDRRHAISAVLSYRASRKWELASTTRWATGFPRTAPLGVRVAGKDAVILVAPPGGGPVSVHSAITPARDFSGNLLYEVNLGGVSNLNNARLPYFARTDVRATWKPHGLDSRWEFYVEVLNITNRKNAGVLTPELAYDPTSDRPRIVELAEQSIPRLPTLGLRWRF